MILKVVIIYNLYIMFHLVADHMYAEPITYMYLTLLVPWIFNVSTVMLYISCQKSCPTPVSEILALECAEDKSICL